MISQFHNQKHKMKDNNNKCGICGKTFSEKGSLTVHIKNIHLKDLSTIKMEDLQCEFCEKRFVFKKSLQKHIISEHEYPKNSRCDLCNKTFSGITALESHIKWNTSY